MGGNTSYAQDVTCATCNAGICEGESLADYITFSGYTFPIDINSVSGAATGSGSNIFNYTFTGGASFVSLNFTEGNGSVHTETVPVNVNAINAAFSYSSGGSCGVINFNGNSSSATGTIVAYDWSVFQINGAINTLVTNLSGQTPSYTFATGGTYDVCLTITDNNGCTSQSCALVNVGDVIPALTFVGNGQNLSENDSQLVVPYCNSSAQPFSLLAADNSELNGLSISNYIILVDGNIEYNEASAPGSISIYNASAGTVEYIQVDIVITDVSGCSYTTSYQVYIGNFSTPSFSSQLATTDLGCPEEELIIQNNNNPDNPNGSDYTLNILCGGDSIVVDSWVWEQTTPEDNLSWTPPFSSCLCDNGNFYFSTSAVHPCMTTPQLSTSNFQVALPPEAEFIRLPGGNICFDEEVTFEWLFGSSLDYPGSWNWCDPSPVWSITDPNGVMSTVGYDPFLDYVFPIPGNYEVCLEVFSDCGVPQVCENICVNPPISQVILDPTWNIPDTLCPGDEFTSTLTHSDLPFCDIPTVTWKLVKEGVLVETFTGLSADVQNLQQGNYELEAVFKLKDCGEVSVAQIFEVFAPPIITPQIVSPFSGACEGDQICFDDWFCIDDSGIPITDFEIRLYEGFLNNCPENPSANLVETITNTPPFPPYADCDPTPGVCSYNWTAVPGKYTLWIKAENHCGRDYACITIDIPFPEVPVIMGDSEVCLDEVINLNASLPSGSFQFISCPTGNCPAQGSGPGQFTTSGTTLTWNTANGINPYGDYTVSYGGDCIETGTLVITLNPLPEFSILSDLGNTICAGDELTLDIDYLGINPLDHCNWIDLSSGSTISTIDCQITTYTEPGSNEYQATIVDENGCEAVNTIQIDGLTQPFSLNCSTIQNAYCNNAGATIQLNTLLSPTPTSGVIEWQLDGTVITGPTLSLDGLAQGNHELSYTWNHPLPPNCPFTGSCNINITPPAVPNISTQSEYCAGEVVNLSANVPGNIPGNWQFESCPGTCPSVFTATDLSLNWNTSTSTPAGTYTVSYSGDCLEYQEISFEINPIPNFTITSNAISGLCGGDELTLGIDYSGSQTLTCIWTDNNTGMQIPGVDCTITHSPVDPTTSYTVLVTDGNSCSNSESINIQIQDQPFDFDCSAIQPSYCDNEVAQINLSDLVGINAATTGFTWFLNGTPHTGNTINVATLDPDEYTIAYVFTHAQAPYCVFEDSCSFTISALTTPIISGNDPLCVGDEINLTITGTAGFSGTWEFTGAPGSIPTDFTSTSSSLNWPTTNTTESGIFTVTYSGECLSSMSHSFEIYSLPNFTISSNALSGLCDGGEVIMSVDYSGSQTTACEWTNENTGSQIPDADCSITVNPTDPSTTYSVVVTDDNTCSASASIDIQIQEQPFDFDCSNIQDNYCDNEVAEIDLADLVTIGPSNAGFTWLLNGDVLSESTIDVLALSPDDYTLSYVFMHTEVPNCTFGGSCSFSITSLTTPTITGSDPICAGEEINLNISGTAGFSGIWEFTETPENIPTDFTSTATSLIWLTTNQTESGTYTVTYTGNCLTPVSYSFDIFALPEFTILSIPDAVFCAEDSVHLSVNYLGNAEIESCEWTNSTGQAIPNQDCQIGIAPQSDTEVYTVSVTDTNSCAVTDSIELNTQHQPFEFSCETISASYCDNEEATIQFSDLVSIPLSPDFEWFLNDSPISENSLEIQPLSASETSYILSYNLIS